MILPMVNVSIITPTTDSSSYVDEAVLSVPRTELATIEHIIVHDGTREFLARLASLYPWLRLVEGPGRGATAACSMAIAEARGEFIFPLMSDDRMAAGALRRLAEAAASRPDIEVWTGGIRVFEQDSGAPERVIRTISDRTITALTLANVLDDLPLLNARFVRRAVYERVGPWNEKFSASSDREFAIRMVLADVREAPLGVLVAELRRHAGSQTIRPRSNFLPPYLAEHMALARQWMSDAGLSAEMRSCFRDWHAREVLRAFYYAARNREFGVAGETLRNAFAADGTWPRRAFTTLAALRRRRRNV